jgi:hypothetical protein
MYEKGDALQKIESDFNNKKENLERLTDLYEGVMEQRRRKEEEQRKIKEKSDDQQKQRDLLDSAAAWVQAHWKGLNTRRDVEKTLRSKKKKKRKKK